MTQQEKRCLLRLNNKVSFDFFFGVYHSIYEVSKEDMKEIVRDYHYFEKTQKTQQPWREDKEILKNLINSWCEVFRCYSLYIH